MSPRSSVLFVDHFTKQFGRLRAVDDISFSVKPGEIVGFVGPNGAGKTTTIASLLGFLRPTHGTITLFGDAILPENAHRYHTRIGYAAGDMALLDNLTGAQYLQHMAHLTRVNKTHQHELIEQFDPVLDKPLRQLSRGNKQKIALVTALQHEPKLLILDEPTTGLDPLMQDIFLGMLKKQSRDGTTVFMSSHILGEVTDVCERVLFMKHGRIILDERVKNIESHAGKEIRIKADKASLLALMKTRPSGLGKPSTSADGYVVCLYKGPVSKAIAWLNSQKIKDVIIRDRDFESIFHDMYQTEGDSL